jgi:hypothetical protein
MVPCPSGWPTGPKGIQQGANMLLSMRVGNQVWSALIYDGPMPERMAQLGQNGPKAIQLGAKMLLSTHVGKQVWSALIDDGAMPERMAQLDQNGPKAIQLGAT